MAAKIESALGVAPQLVRGSGGVFDVVVNGQLRYSKFETHNFPDESALVAQLKSQP